MIVCPFCHRRVNEWEMCSNKATVIFGRLCHKSCLMGEKDAHHQTTLLRLPKEDGGGAPKH